MRFIALRYVPRSDIAGLFDNCIQLFKSLTDLFLKVLYHLTFPPPVEADSSFSASWLTLAVTCLFYPGPPNGRKVVDHCGFALPDG